MASGAKGEEEVKAVMHVQLPVMERMMTVLNAEGNLKKRGDRKRKYSG